MKKYLRELFNIFTRNLNEVTISGEFWIHNDGSIEYADGDIGDKNHDILAQEHIIHQFYDIFDIYQPMEDSISTLDNMTDYLKQWFEENGAFEDSSSIELFDNDPAEFILSNLPRFYDIKNVFPEEGQFEKALMIAYNQVPYGARDYAMKYLKWKRLAGNWIQTETLSTDDLKAIVNGLQEAHDIDEEDNPKYNIEINANRKVISNVPFSVLKKATKLGPSILKKYISVGFSESLDIRNIIKEKLFF